ncbi:MAG TPA: TonB family protein [Steroidobacteraceae bacterium]|nr:TonB family protein [Steroidobacteraceae bacterium]
MTTRTIEWAPPPRRSTAFLAIVALHVLVIYGFLTVFVPPKLHAPVPPMSGEVLNMPRSPPTKAPRPAPFTPGSGEVFQIPNVPLAPIHWDYSDPSSTAITTGTESSGGAGPSVPLSYVVTKPIDEFYPPGSIRLNEEGASTLQVCVAANGALAGAPALQSSSGYPRLDAAALKWAREALRFTPAQQDGKAVPACKGFRVSFKLRT